VDDRDAEGIFLSLVRARPVSFACLTFLFSLQRSTEVAARTKSLCKQAALWIFYIDIFSFIFPSLVRLERPSTAILWVPC
jgi:hypothetical protein